MSAKLISVMGPVAVGKTTLAEVIARRLNAELVLEDFVGNPFLAESYGGFDELTLPSQLYFLLSRVKQLGDWTWPAEGLVVTDYGFCQDRIFATIKLEDDDRLFYEHICRQIEFLVHQPAVLVHLDAPVDVLVERIKARGRGFELEMERDFLEQLRQDHFDAPAPDRCEIIRVDTSQQDIRSQAVQDDIIEQIRKGLWA